jgi:hypothetical protein
MASKTVEVILKAKNMMAGGIASAGASLKSFGSGLYDFGKKAAVGIIAMGTAIAGFALKAVSAYAESEKAVKQLSSAFSVNGDEVEKNVEASKRIAAAIQDETGASDDATIATMARLRMLGVMPAALEAAAKGVIALRSAGLDEAAATKAVAQAHAGNFAALSKAIPALKNATSESEKARLVNDFLTKGYQAQKDELHTVSGSWGLLKERVGDVWEEIGAVIAQNDGLQKMLDAAGDAVKRFGERIAEWAGAGGVQKLTAGVLTFAENARHSWNEIRLAFDLVSSFIADAWGTSVKYMGNVVGALKNKIVADFTFIKDFAIAQFEKIKHPFSEFKPPSMQPSIDAAKKYFAALKGDGAKVTTAMDATYAAIEAEATRHAERLAKIEADKVRAIEENGKKQVEATKAVAQQINVAVVNDLAARQKAWVAGEKNQADKLKAEIEAEKAALEEKKKLAAMRVNDFIKDAQGKKDEAKALVDDQKAADRLRAKQARMDERGGANKLSKRDQERLAAANAIRDAQNGINPAAAAIEAKERRLEALQVKIEEHTKIMADKLSGNLEFGGAQ